MVDEIVSDWELALGEPYVPSGACAWAARVRGAGGEQLVLKVGWRHPEAEHEGDALEHWSGDGAVRCFRTRTFDRSTALLLERCAPGTALGSAVPEREQDVVIAGLQSLAARARPAASGVSPGQGSGKSWCSCAKRRSSSVSVDSSTGVTSDQCRPTGQRWKRQATSRKDLTDAPGIQSVVNR